VVARITASSPVVATSTPMPRRRSPCRNNAASLASSSTTRTRTPSALHESAQGLLQGAGGGQHRGRLVAAVGHAVVTARVAPAPVGVPVGGLDQLFIGFGVAVGHQVTRTLPAEQRIAGDAPGSAAEVHLPLEEVEEQRRVVEPPALAPAVRERRPEQLVGLAYAEEVLLVGRLLV